MDVKLGVLGGGQLGMMLIEAAQALNVTIDCMDSDPNAPCSQIANEFRLGSLTDYEQVLSFGRNYKVLTVEIENVSVEALEQLQREGIKVFPQPHVLKTIKDKGIQKEFYTQKSIPTADYILIEQKSDLPSSWAFPFVHKLRVGGYDGKGVQVIKNQDDWDHSFEGPALLEKLIPFEKELSLIVARNETGEIRTFPLVECQFNPLANLVEFQFSPAEVSDEVSNSANEMARKIILELEMVGLLAVEFFLSSEGLLLVNEMAPRPHNSGHHTIECCITSQFQQHLRSVLNWPLGDTSLKSSGAMLNILGEKDHQGLAYFEGLDAVESMDGVFVHLYRKTMTKPFRKMGHVTLLGESLDELKAKAEVVKKSLRCISAS